MHTGKWATVERRVACARRWKQRRRGRASHIYCASSNDGDAWWQWDVLGVFDAQYYTTRWVEPPFSRVQVAGGLVLWNLAFIASGLFTRSAVAWLQLTPAPSASSEMEQQAWLIAFLSALQLGCTAIVTSSIVSSHKLTVARSVTSHTDAADPLNTWLDLNPHSISDAFRLKDGWLTWSLLGLFGAPFAVAGASALASQLGLSQDGSGTTVQPLMPLLDNASGGNGDILIPLGSSVAFSSPIMEELVFRGMLLPSVTKWTTTPGAVVVSALAFTANHSSIQSSPQLLSLSLILGFAYVRTRNLLTPMLIHGCWNGLVLAIVVAFPDLVFQSSRL